MANKRTLKKNIRKTCEALFAETIAIALYGPEKDKENLEALLNSIVSINNDYLDRVSHPEPGMSANDYYNDLIEKFNAQISEIQDQLNA
jgi:hypothetical protein